MTKKKNNRQKRQKDVPDTSEEELQHETEAVVQGKSCAHVSRAVNFGRVKRALKNGNIYVCSGCTDTVIEEENAPEIWLCLQCGYHGCGRLSPNKHGLQHFKTIHSDCHSLVLSSSSGYVWCYDCDEEVPLQSSHSLRQCVEFILKLKVNPKSPVIKTADEKKSSSNQQSLLETVLKDQTAIKNAIPEVPKKTNLKADKKDASSKISVKGLRNLGNTCYFNAVMQNLSQTSLLFHVLEESSNPEYKWEIPKLVLAGDTVVEDTNADTIKIALPPVFMLVNTFLQFLKKMLATPQNKADVINPNDLFSHLQKKSPQFQYFLQQDSHELLRQFLDGIRQDEMKRHKKAILRHFNLINTSLEDVDDEMKKLIKGYGCYASHTIVEKIFGGLLISTVLCEECKMSSQVFEPFMDMSLPLFEEKHQENSPQPYALLDGGKQEIFEPIRNRKSEVEPEDTSEEYILNNKSKKDYGKPSKHQEKKMKQLEKKEKKRSKKLLNKNPVQVLKSSLQTEGSSNLELEIQNGEKVEGAIDNHDVSSEVSNQSKHDEAAEEATIGCEPNIQIILPNRTGDSDSIDKVQECNGSGINCNINGDIEGTVTIGVELATEKTNEQDDLILFDEVIHLNDESTETASPVQEINDDLHSDEERMELQNEPLSNETAASSDKHEDNINISTIDSSSLVERMQALSMEVKEVRIRRDSDRQESILSSSSCQSAGDGESPKTNCVSDDSVENKSGNECEEDLSYNLSESQTKEWILKSLTTLRPRKHVVPLECSIDTCLTHFTKPELLTGNNKFRCENCTEIKRRKSGDKKAVAYSNASKQLLIFSPPAILTLHLKRFQQVGMSLRKVNRFVDFPLILDLASYCSSACLILPHMASVKEEILYSLYGIVEHSGHLRSGHYTAYVKISKRTLNKTFMSQLPMAQCDLEQLLRKFSRSAGVPASNGESISSSKEGQWYYISDGHVKEVSEAQVLKCQAYLLFYERIK